jgi:hypothetical protein
MIILREEYTADTDMHAAMPVGPLTWTGSGRAIGRQICLGAWTVEIASSAWNGCSPGGGGGSADSGNPNYGFFL